MAELEGAAAHGDRGKFGLDLTDVANDADAARLDHRA